MRDRMGPALWEEWLHFMELEPLGGPATDQRLAYLLANLANLQSPGRTIATNRFTPWRLPDFLITWRARGPRRGKPGAGGGKPKRMDAEQTRAHVAGIMAAFGGVDPRYPDAQPRRA